MITVVIRRREPNPRYIVAVVPALEALKRLQHARNYVPHRRECKLLGGTNS